MKLKRFLVPIFTSTAAGLLLIILVVRSTPAARSQVQESTKQLSAPSPAALEAARGPLAAPSTGSLPVPPEPASQIPAAPAAPAAASATPASASPKPSETASANAPSPSQSKSASAASSTDRAASTEPPVAENPSVPPASGEAQLNGAQANSGDLPPPLPVPPEMGEWAVLLAPYDFDPRSHRDPFSRSAGPVLTDTGAGPSNEPLLPLQRYDLEQIRLLGIIWNVNNPKAMFLDPDKQIHILEKNDRIGKKNGRIRLIREGEVVVVEPEVLQGNMSLVTKVLKIAR